MQKEKLTLLRKKIDQIDDQLVQLVAKRMKIVNKVKNYKKRRNLAITDKNREEQIINRLKLKAKKLNVSIKLIEKIIRLIINESKKLQKIYV